MELKHTKNEIVSELVRLYVEEEASTYQIANLLPISPKAAGKILKELGLLRSAEERSALASTKISYRGKGGLWHSTKSGKWFPAASKYELVRMSQLDADESIKHWSRDVPRITYRTNHKYVPDFYIEYVSGQIVIEEVKPAFLVKHSLNLEKWDAARKYFSDTGIIFRVVTEDEIGLDAIKNFKFEGFNGDVDAIRRKRYEQVKKEYHERNKEKIEAYRQKYRTENKEQIRQYHREVRKKNPDKYREKDRKATLAYKDKRKEYKKKYHQENRERIVEKVTKWNEEHREHRREYLRQYYLKRKAAGTAW